jgi:hypothetical protein
MNLLYRIFEETSFDENEDYNIYLTGSRVYGTNTEKSDYDIYMIVSDKYFKKFSKKNSNLGEEEYECLYFGENLNINLYSKSLFQKKLNENWLQALMCFYSEEENCLMRKFEFEIEICFRKLGRSVIGESGKHYEMARRKWNQENSYNSKKYLVHSFRDFMFGIQIAKVFKIVDFKCANDLYFEIMNESLLFTSYQEMVEWEKYDEKYHKVYETLKEKFQDLVIWKDENMNIIDFIMSNDIQLLKLYFSIHVNKSGNNLILTSDLIESPRNYKLVRQCEGIILNNKSEIKCNPLERFYSHQDHNVAKIDLKSSKVFYNFDFMLINLYFDEEWKFSTRNEIGDSKILKKFEAIFKQNFNFPEEQNLTFVFTFRKEDSFIKMEEYIYLFAVKKEKEMETSFFASKYKWKEIPVIYKSIKNLDFLFSISFSLDPLKYSGFIVMDDEFNRLQVDSTTFTSFNNLLKRKNENFSTLDLMRSDPNLKIKKLIPLNFQLKYIKFVDFLQTYYDSLVDLDFKNFAKKVKDDFKKIFLKMKKNNISNVKDYLKTTSTKEIEILFEKFE